MGVWGIHYEYGIILGWLVIIIFSWDELVKKDEKVVVSVWNWGGNQKFHVIFLCFLCPALALLISAMYEQLDRF